MYVCFDGMRLLYGLLLAYLMFTLLMRMCIESHREDLLVCFFFFFFLKSGSFFAAVVLEICIFSGETRLWEPSVIFLNTKIV